MFSSKVDTIFPENLLITSEDGSFMREVEVLRVTYRDFFLRKMSGFNGAQRNVREISRSINTLMMSASTEVTAPMCYIDKLEYGRKLNNTGVYLCLL